MPNIVGKTHNSRHIHQNTDMIEVERENDMLHIVITQYALKQDQRSSGNKVKKQSRRN